MDLMLSLLARQGFLPHGYCFSWTPGLLWSMVAADAAIALSYFSIPVVILRFMQQRRDRSLYIVGALFSAFIFSCGLTHVMDIWTIWQPDYGLQALSKLVTAAVSIATAIALWPLLPKALKVPSVARLQGVIDDLQAEVRKRRSAEATLLDAELNLAVALGSFGAGFIATDRSGSVTHLNEVGQQLLGWSEADARGQLLWEVFQRDGREAAMTALNPVDVVMHEGITLADSRRVTAISRQGVRTLLEVKASITRADDGAVRGLAIVFRDMTRVAEIEGESSRLAAIVDSSNDAIVGKTLAGIITSWNPGAERLFGYTGGEAIGQSIQMLIPAHLVDEERSILARIGNGERVETFETVRLHKDGSEIQVASTISPVHDAQGRVIGASKIAHDITDRKQAQAALVQAEQRLRLVVEAAPSGMLMVDQSGRIVLANQRAAELFGYLPEGLVGQEIDGLVPAPGRAAHADHRAAYQAAPTWRSMAGRAPLFGLRRDGSQVPLEIDLSPIQMPDGNFILASVVDITERKRQEDELRRSNAELEQFAYIASHDLQEPLRMVVSYSELLAKRYQGKLDEKADKYIFYAVDGARRMQMLVADLMAYSRVGSQGKPLLPVDTALVVQRVLRDLQVPISQAGATIDVHALPPVLADEGQLGQVFQNLIANAVKFRAEVPLRVTVSAQRVPEGWQFTVADNGIGIDLQYADRIFQMFQRLHERGKFAGSGIGLAIVKRIVERHGGRIWVASESGRGSTFLFTLKSADAGTAPA
jgi:PAS domain S-box-containing protein